MARIREYDIEKFNISVLLNENIITLEEYNAYKLDPDRNVKIGIMIRDKPELGISGLLARYKKEIVGKFISINKLAEDDIEEVNHDAIWIRGGKTIRYSNIDGFNVRKKKEFTSILTVENMKFYYNSILDIFDTRYVGKDIKDNITLLDTIKSVMSLIESGLRDKAYILLHNYKSGVRSEIKLLHEILDIYEL